MAKCISCDVCGVPLKDDRRYQFNMATDDKTILGMVDETEGYYPWQTGATEKFDMCKTCFVCALGVFKECVRSNREFMKELEAAWIRPAREVQS